MELDEIVESRAHRTIKRQVQYRDLTKPTGDLAYFDYGALQPGDRLIGVYENVPGTPQDCLVVSILGIYIPRSEHWQFIGYRQMTHAQIPLEGEITKTTADTLLLHLDNGQIELPIRGGQGKFRDIWEFSRYLNRVIEAFQRHIADS